jgi:NTP pyrophosphatase (non-canonical NTP hydrolase)
MELEKRLAVAGLGIGGEAGEVADMLKKHIGHGHDLEVDKLGKELGDVLWYIQEIGHIIGYPLEQIARDNIEKLKKRYPGGFDEEKSINRED